MQGRRPRECCGPECWHLARVWPVCQGRDQLASPVSWGFAPVTLGKTFCMISINTGIHIRAVTHTHIYAHVSLVRLHMWLLGARALVDLKLTMEDVMMWPSRSHPCTLLSCDGPGQHPSPHPTPHALTHPGPSPSLLLMHSTPDSLVFLRVTWTRGPDAQQERWQKASHIVWD